ncbi:multimeric flavodoxin WrbA [Cryobacterium sp. MP_3.1]|uniref:flavodoxin family protein n=1 Tax=Cryobacterium sp. MP_3.1 TaxID=3071711 RepID=UPI002DFA585B|nr:multimeric flavodoxin WrbA [Cryobacterium sp. MP_3.1]
MSGLGATGSVSICNDHHLNRFWRAHVVADADAIIFGTPTYMGSASGAFHAFAEAPSKPWMQRTWQDKLAAGFTISGSMSGFKLHTLQYLSLLAALHGMH